MVAIQIASFPLQSGSRWLKIFIFIFVVTLKRGLLHFVDTDFEASFRSRTGLKPCHAGLETTTDIITLSIVSKTMSNVTTFSFVNFSANAQLSNTSLWSQGFREIFLQSVGFLWFCNQIFLLTLREKISAKNHLIDDSNKYKFIYVPRWISNQKKMGEFWVSNFFPVKVPDRE